MKSKTSCFNGPVFRKNLTRFAPAWILYTLCLLLGLVLLSESGVEYWLSANIATSIGFMGIVNLGYGLLCALLLFGDLTQPKLCNALHALPLRRETWFCTNVLSGLFFSVIPTVIMTVPAVIASFFSAMENGWQITLYWLLGTNLEFVFFFGLAVLCMFLTGNRIGASVIYTIVNFLSILAFYLAEIIYVPHLYGVVAQMDPFLTFCPTAKMVTASLVNTEPIYDFLHYADGGSANYLVAGQFTLGEDWWYLWVCAAIGVVLLVLALLLYKKRKLECAGDLMATRVLEPVFLALFSLVSSGAFQLIYVAAIGYEAYGSTAFLWVGLAVGWFVGLMLLRRSSRVFSKKSFLGLLLMALILGASLLINALDLFGLTNWTPAAEDVESVTMHLSLTSSITLEEPEDIEEVIALHAEAAEARQEGELKSVNVPVELKDGAGTYIQIEYTMKSGSTAAREYMVLIDSKAGEIARKFFSRIDAVFNSYYDDYDEPIYSAEDLMALPDVPQSIYIDGVALPDELLTPENVDALLEAIIADSEAGNLAQHTAFHSSLVFEDTEKDIFYTQYNLQISYPDRQFGVRLNVYGDSANILAWIDENGLTDLLHQMILEKNGYG